MSKCAPYPAGLLPTLLIEQESRRDRGRPAIRYYRGEARREREGALICSPAIRGRSRRGGGAPGAREGSRVDLVARRFVLTEGRRARSEGCRAQSFGYTLIKFWMYGG